MSSNSNGKTASSGISFFGMLGILFIGLKLAGIISWSWLWVLSPLWGPVAVVVVILGMVLIALLIDNTW